MINEFGVNAFSSLMGSEGGFIKSYEPLKVSFDYFGYLKDKYQKEIDAKDGEETQHQWDELPIKPSLKQSAMAGELPKEPEHPYEKETFVITKTTQKKPVNYDDLVIPTVAKEQQRAVGNYVIINI